MFWLLALILFMLWMLGLAVFHGAGTVIHLLLVLALIALLAHVVRRRRPG